MKKGCIYNYSKLRGKIKEKFGTQTVFASQFPMSEATLSKKLNSNIGFSQKEMQKTCDLFYEPYSMIPAYFFTYKVQ